MTPNTPSPAPTRLEKIPATALLLLAIVSIQAGGALAVGLFASLGPLGTVSLRVGIAAVILLLIGRPRLDSRVRAHLPQLVAFGLSIAGMNVFVYQAFARIPLGTAITLEFIGPLSMAVFLSHRKQDFFWAGLAAAGTALLTPITGAKLDPVGVVFALLAGACWVAYARMGAVIGRLFPGFTGLSLGIAIAALVLLPFGGLQASAAFRHPPLLMMGLVVALASTVIPFSLEFEALRRLPARTYGILVSLDPAAAAVSGALILHQAPTWRTIAAIACVVSAAIGVTLAASRDAKTADE